MTTEIATPASQPLSELVSQLSNDLSALAKKEAELTKQELSEKLDSVKTHAGALALGGAALAAGLLVLLTAAVLALSLVMAPWLAAFLVGGTVTAGGAVMIATSKAKLERSSLKPDRALQSMKRDVKAIKEAAT